MRGCAGSRLTGPAPLGGARNSPETVTHPTLGLGAKSGGAVCAAAAKAAPAMDTTPASKGALPSNGNIVRTLMISAPFFPPHDRRDGLRRFGRDHTPATRLFLRRFRPLRAQISASSQASHGGWMNNAASG